MTYAETIESLRCCFSFGTCSECKAKSMMEEDPLPWKLDCKDRLGLYAADLIERLTAENAKAEAERDALREKQRWIPVTERLPERDVQVLGWYKDNPFSQYRPEVVAWNGNGWVFVYAHRYVTNVTHWMPLPEAPEVK